MADSDLIEGLIARAAGCVERARLANLHRQWTVAAVELGVASEVCDEAAGLVGGKLTDRADAERFAAVDRALGRG